MQVDCSGWLCKLIDRVVQDWTREGAHELHELDESYEWELCASLMTVMNPMSLMSLSCVCVCLCRQFFVLFIWKVIYGRMFLWKLFGWLFFHLVHLHTHGLKT